MVSHALFVVVVEQRGEMWRWPPVGIPAARSYAGIAEFSVTGARPRGGGAGQAALEGLFEAAGRAGFWKLVSRVFVANLASRALMRRVGFREVGIYERHARIDGVWKDVVIVERQLAE